MITQYKRCTVCDNVIVVRVVDKLYPNSEKIKAEFAMANALGSHLREFHFVWEKEGL